MCHTKPVTVKNDRALAAAEGMLHGWVRLCEAIADAEPNPNHVFLGALFTWDLDRLSLPSTSLVSSSYFHLLGQH